MFDQALRPFELNNGQFSLLMALNRPEPPSIGALAPFRALDRTSLTAALKPLERRGLVRIEAGKTDRRSRLIRITTEGVALLDAALLTWRGTHARLDATMADEVPDRLRADLRQVPSVVEAVSSSGAKSGSQR